MSRPNPGFPCLPRQFLLLVLAMPCALPVYAGVAPARLEELEALVLASEPGALAREARSRALAESAVAARALPDPELELGLMSIPVGGLARDIEPMSQIGVGLRQRFPAGRSLAAEGDAIAAESSGEAYGAQAQRELARRELRSAWVEWLYWRDSVVLLEEQQKLLAGLLSAREAAWAGAADSREDTLGLALAQERLGAEIAMARGEARAEWSRLGRWLPEPMDPAPEAEWPRWSLAQFGADAPATALAPRLVEHPAIRALAEQVQAREFDTEAAREAYRPEWGLSLEYGARPGETRDGMPLDDLYSARVSVALPLFPADRQDRRLAAARENREAARADRDAALRRLRAELERELAESAQIEERLKRYSSRLLPLAREAVIGAEAAYAAAAREPQAWYRARETELALRRESLRLEADRLRSLARIAWLLPDRHTEAAP